MSDFSLADSQQGKGDTDGWRSKLTSTQIRIVRLRAIGLLHKQIAFKLGLSFQTVANHMVRINRILGVHGRKQLQELVQRSQPADPASEASSQPKKESEESGR